MPPRTTERREFQRLHLAEPLPARYGGQDVAIVEVGITGARLEHAKAFRRGASRRLIFVWNGDRIEIECDIIHTRHAGDDSLQSGIRFLQARGQSDCVLRSQLTNAVAARIAIRRAEERHLTEKRPIDADATLRARDAAYTSYRLEDGRWKKRRSFLPEQPSVGFTVAKGENAKRLERLCRDYENSDSEGRRLIRLFAELSISEAIGVPPRE